MVSSSDWLAIATSILAAVSALSVVVSWRENKRNRKLAALERRNNNFYSPLFLLLQSIGYNVENKSNLQKKLLDLCFSNFINVGPEINKTVKDYMSSIAQLPDISKEARNALAAYKAAEVPIPPKLQLEISNAQRNSEILFKQFLKTIIEKGLVEYRMLLSEVSKINGEKFSDFKFSFETVNELLQQL